MFWRPLLYAEYNKGNGMKPLRSLSYQAFESMRLEHVPLVA